MPRSPREPSPVGLPLAALAPVLIYLALLLRPLGMRPSSRILGPYGGADALMQAGILEWTGRHLGHFASWLDPPVFYPATRVLTFMDALLGQAVLVWPARALGAATPALAYNLALILSLVLAAFAFAWLWRATGGRWRGAGFGALVIIGSPYTTSQMGHLNQLPPPAMLAALAVLLPGVRAWRMGRPLSRWRFWLWASLLIVQAVWGWYGLTYAILASGLVLCWAIWRYRRNGRLIPLLRALAGPAALAGAGIVLAALPYLQTARLYPDFQRRPAEVRAFSADLGHLVNRGAYRAGWRDWLGGRRGESERPYAGPRQVLHPGWLALAAALGGWMLRGRLPAARRRDGNLFVIIGAVGLVLAFGDSVGVPGRPWRLPLPLGLLQDLLIPLRALRAAWRFSFLSLLAVAWWAAAGLDMLPNRRWWNWRLALPVGVVFAVLGLESLPVGLPARALASDQVAAAAWRALPAGAVLTLPAPPAESVEDALEARWWQRMLMHGHPVTGGVSGWVPPCTRRLRRELGECEAGSRDPAQLLASLQGQGIRFAELALAADPQRVAAWQDILQRLLWRGRSAGQGYMLYLPPAAARDTLSGQGSTGPVVPIPE